MMIKHTNFYKALVFYFLKVNLKQTVDFSVSNRWWLLMGFSFPSLPGSFDWFMVILTNIIGLKSGWSDSWTWLSFIIRNRCCLRPILWNWQAIIVNVGRRESKAVYGSNTTSVVIRILIIKLFVEWTPEVWNMTLQPIYFLFQFVVLNL